MLVIVDCGTCLASPHSLHCGGSLSLAAMLAGWSHPTITRTIPAALVYLLRHFLRRSKQPLASLLIEKLRYYSHDVVVDL